METIHATYEAGVFRPLSPVHLPEHCEVEFEVRMISEAPLSEDRRRQLALAATGVLTGPRDLSAREGFDPR